LAEALAAASLARFPLPASRFPLPASRFPLPASRFPLPAFRFPLPASRFPLPARSLVRGRSRRVARPLLLEPLEVLDPRRERPDRVRFPRLFGGGGPLEHPERYVGPELVDGDEEEVQLGRPGHVVAVLEVLDLLYLGDDEPLDGLRYLSVAQGHVVVHDAQKVRVPADELRLVGADVLELPAFQAIGEALDGHARQAPVEGRRIEPLAVTAVLVGARGAAL